MTCITVRPSFWLYSVDMRCGMPTTGEGCHSMGERVIPNIKIELCNGCGDCLSACPEGALALSPQGGPIIDQERCAYCGDCEDVCPVGAIALPYAIVLLPTSHPKGD